MPTAKYDKPPVNEVVMGLKFKPIEGLRSEHVGLFWQKIEDKYPVSQQAANYGNPQKDQTEIYPAPRFWFLTESLDKLVQIQNNCFLCNWRKVDGQGIYPDYNVMKKMFTKNYSLFLSFLREKEFKTPEPFELEFTYVNHFLEGVEFKEIKEITKIIKSIKFPDTLSGKKATQFDLNYQFDLPDADKGKLQLKFSTGTLKNTRQRLIVFENKAHGLDPSSDDIYKWFDYAHEQLVKNFEKLASDDIQNTIWEKREAT